MSLRQVQHFIAVYVGAADIQLQVTHGQPPYDDSRRQIHTLFICQSVPNIIFRALAQNIFHSGVTSEHPQGRALYTLPITSLGRVLDIVRRTLYGITLSSTERRITPAEIQQEAATLMINLGERTLVILPPPKSDKHKIIRS